uniref:Carboxymuconolactone decarboxylase family protein n=1 Tax=Aerophobetes bacterium TaxID=2030807 RepID=A0A2A4YGP3_UNCAE
MGKYIKRVQNPVRAKAESKEEIASHFKELLDELPGLSFESKGAPVDVFGILLKSKTITELFAPFWAKSKAALKLSQREQEIIILKTACIYGCDYVWGHHDPIAIDVMTKEEILQIPLPFDEQDLPLREKVLIQTTGKILSHANLTDEEYKELKKHYTEEQILDIIVVVSQYVLFNSVNNIFGIKLEDDSMPNLPDM